MQCITLQSESWINHILAQCQQIINKIHKGKIYWKAVRIIQGYVWLLKCWYCSGLGEELPRSQKLGLLGMTSVATLLHNCMQDLPLSLTPPHRPAGERQRERRRRWVGTRPLRHLQPLCSWLAGRGPQSPAPRPLGSVSLQIYWRKRRTASSNITRQGKDHHCQSSL